MNEMGLEDGDNLISSRRELSDIIGGIQDEQVKNIFMMEVLLLVFSDGDYSDDEKQVVMDMKRLFGFSDETYEVLKNWVIRYDQIKVEGVKLMLNPNA
jgi:hypothetical protein